ncbi:hypothetical protein [Sinorhizobium meliloti]|uniref:hypothetical protein n=1 Tax=Rhizobium meliloti TaxID=382 RepID=UPI001F3930A6|nr:hypothetical protein [Sinorhizobium meliloti]
MTRPVGPIDIEIVVAIEVRDNPVVQTGVVYDLPSPARSASVAVIMDGEGPLLRLMHLPDHNVNVAIPVHVGCL